MKHYLITGGCGFIGGHLAHELSAAGHRVTVLDDFSSGREDNAPPEARIVRGCVTDGALLSELAGTCDGIVHLAAIASVEAAADDPERAVAVNVGGTRNALAAARSGNIPLVYASSAAVYGDAGARRVRESDRCAPISDYGAQKLECERELRGIGPLATIVRPFNVYGPRQHPASPYSGVIARFIALCRTGEPLRINGDGSQSRDFVYIADIVRLLTAALKREAGEPLTVNGCTGQTVTVLELAGAIAAACGTEPDIRHGPARAGDILHSCGDPDLAAASLGFKARTPLDAGLRETVAWQRGTDQ
ncbi:NAD-dependent epimerase/dehydratase family protein [Nisaea acidiphila]|uniref:NAD-dependent epimerase/dehydratase family protein n=1 Tax=Nisaea acidiphila TaxID=1862145 RepID=A0A9J7AW77_9PROT|nr:NAD-dependent epimerase/dehydratase family protein [Nisaea acidiphila]UUX52051.1 NAD-dependent epimerase/dehydratase family protein [Nisaea acidiphila]